MDSGVTARLIELMRTESQAQVPALEAIGNFVSGDDRQTQTVLKLDVVPALLGILTNMTEKTPVKRVVWTFSNITAGTPEQIQLVLDAGAFGILISLMGSIDVDIQREAGWCVSNACSGGNANQVEYLVDNVGVVPAICNLLKSTDNLTLTVALEGLESILKSAIPSRPSSTTEVLLNENHDNSGGIYTRVVDSIVTIGAEEDLRGICKNGHGDPELALRADRRLKLMM